MRYLLAIFLLVTTRSLFAQADFQLNGRNVNIDSVFFKRSNALSHYNDNIDSVILQTKNNAQRTTLIYIKAVKFFSENKWEESNRLLKFCMSHVDSLNALARFRIEILYGYNLVLLGYVPLGMKYMARVDSSAEALGDPTLIINIKNFYAEANRNIGRLDRAKEILETGAKYVDKANWSAQLSYTLSLVTTLNQLAVDKKDISFAAKASSLTETILDDPSLKNVDQVLYGSMLAEKGASLSILKKHPEAIEFFVRAQQIFLPVFPAGAFNQEINIFHEYVNLKDYNKVIKMGEALLPRFDEFKELSGRKIEIYQRLSDAYEETGNTKMALYYTHLLITEKETADQIRYSKDLAELDEKYKNSRIEEEIRIANMQKETSEKNAQQKAEQLKYTIFACLVFATLLVVAIVLAFQFNLARKRIIQQTKDLAQKNLELDNAIKEKDFLFRELHHRVKNNIQLIISFMKLQYKYSSSANLETFIKEIENKMNAMSLVHEKLYAGNTHENIDLKDYLEDISGYILDSLTNLETIPEIAVSGHSVRINIDTAIPVGLIINEVITNSIKHGGDRPDPQINIHLQTTQGFLVLRISDNGKGFPHGFDPEKSSSLGTKAILLLAKQIQSNISWKNNGGAEWELSIPLNKL